jgi:hypothetical protein
MGGMVGILYLSESHDSQNFDFNQSKSRLILGILFRHAHFRYKLSHVGFHA